MLAYRNILLMILIFSMLAIVMGWAFSFLSLWLLLGLLLLNAGSLLTGSLMICSGLYLNVLCSGRKDDKVISLTFDDGPDPMITPRVLDLLEEYDVKAAFFLVGKNIEGNEALVQRMVEEGHVIGNHSYSHHNFFGFMRTKAVMDDLNKTAHLLKKISGRTPGLFRPPFGITNPHIAKAVRSLDYITIGWNIRSLDGIKRNDQQTIDRVITRMKPGGIVLLHDNHAGIFSILENVIEKMLKENYSIVRLDELLDVKPYK